MATSRFFQYSFILKTLIYSFITVFRIIRSLRTIGNSGHMYSIGVIFFYGCACVVASHAFARIFCHSSRTDGASNYYELT